MPRTDEQHRQHLREVERELALAIRENRLTHAICAEYLTAAENVARLDLNRAEYLTEVAP